jgi:hypothetical protein
MTFGFLNDPHPSTCTKCGFKAKPGFALRKVGNSYLCFHCLRDLKKGSK